MIEIAQLKEHIKDEVLLCQERLANFKQALKAGEANLRALQSHIEEWVNALDIDDIEIHHAEANHTLEKYDETFEITLQVLTITFGSCKLHVEPEEQYLHGNRILMYASSDEDDIKEIIESEGKYYFTDLQFGQKRDLSKYTELDETVFYKLLYAWLRS
ncbi:hypothetical protein [Salinicola halimionae]|uniref:hypothetical protein n=1 Tax=Salinicola halimionae TaxID=1949081 RepID=UPI000DA13795|nr:hypothetical protein [Salinicola halimionae]